MLQPFRELVFRPARAPGILSPLTVRSTGHYRLGHQAECNDPRPFTQLFWICGGEVRYHREGAAHAGRTGDVFWYGAREKHRIEPGNPPGEYYWITYDGPLVGEWLRQSGMGSRPRLAGPCPVNLFEQIRRTIRLSSVAAEKEAAALGLELLLAFADTASGAEERLSRDESVCRKLENLVETHFRNPEFGIESAAEALGCHRTTLFRIYRGKRGLSPGAYLQRRRLQHGLELLRQRGGNIAEIAQASGYRDANYFAKVIRRATGEQPRRVRRG